MLLRPRQRAMVGWAQEVGHGWLLPKHQAPTTPLFLEEKKRPALNLLGQDVLCLEALSPLKMQKEAVPAHPDLQNYGRRWAWEQRPDFRHNGFSPALLVAEPRRGRPGAAT